MSARGILTKFVNAKLREQNKSLDGRIAEKVYNAFGVRTSRAKAWVWLAEEMGRQRLTTPLLPVPKKRRGQKKGRAIQAKRWDGFYNSREWRSVRFEALKLSNGCCTLCGRSNRQHGVILHVDHIKPKSKYPDLSLTLSNLQVLCEDCNLGKSNRDDTDWRTATDVDRALDATDWRSF